MPRKLLNLIVRDGSRNFGDLPQTALWYALRDHMAALPGASVTRFLTDPASSARSSQCTILLISPLGDLINDDDE